MHRVRNNPNAMDRHLRMGNVHNRLHFMALMEGGLCTRKFKQGSNNTAKGVGSVYHLRYTAGRRWGGVCKALSLYWIASHATDRDFWTWLFNQNGQLDVINAGRVCDLHGAYKSDIPYAGGIRTRAAGNESKFQFVKRVLGRAGLVERKTAFGGSKSTTRQGFARGNGRTRARQIANIFAPDYQMSQAMYKQLSFHGRTGGHAVAAWVAQDVMFFDPNYGEYWFEDVRRFRNWFEFYWIETRYAQGFDRYFSIDCFGKSINYY